MGIVNVNDDSFSGDGSLDISDSINTAINFVQQGADIIDIGAESARTNRKPISIFEEIDRLTPFLQQFPDAINHAQLSHPIISVNSWRPEVIREVMPLGVDLINDIGGLPEGDDRNAKLASTFDASLLIMHTVGLPKIRHTEQSWTDLFSSMETFFAEKIALAENAGLCREKIVIDPGIDFAKQCDDNLRIYRELQRFSDSFGCRLLLPISRKTVIGDTLDIDIPAERDAGTVACLVSGLMRGAHIFRVHNVRAAKQALKTVTPLLAV